MASFIRFILDNYEALISAAVSLTASILSFISYVKARRSKAISEILSAIPQFIVQIESLFPNGNGVVKLDFVLNQISKLCEFARIPFDKQYFKEQVEKVLATPQSKQ